MKLFKRFISLSLSLSLIITTAAFDKSNWSWGQITSISEQTVAPEAVYRKITLSSPTGPQSINSMEFNPKNKFISMRAGLSNGEVYGNQTVTGIANDFNKLNEGQVVAAINADFFNFGEGVPFGIFMDNGEILSTPPQYSTTFGIKKDGTPFCQSHGTIMNKTLVIGEKKMQLNAINSPHGKATDSIILYNSLYDSSTHSSKDCVEVILSLVSGELRHGETLSFTVDKKITSGGNTKIPANKFILSAKGTYKDVLLALSENQELSVEIKFNEFWSDVSFAISGSHLLLKNGQIQNASSTERTARTMIGIKPNGNVVFYTIDGKLSGFSIGATHKQAATIMRDLGCVDAINLDGGGSTTFAMRYLGTNTVKMINRSASSPRAVANAALLVNTATPSKPTKLLLASAPSKILLGYKHKFSVTGGIDNNYLAYDITSPVNWAVNESVGIISNDGTFTPHAAGVTRVYALVGDASADTYCTVVDSIDSISAASEMTIKSEQTVDIPVSLVHAGTPVTFTKDLLTWEVSGDIGEFISPGKFKAAKFKGTGKIIIKYGKTTKEIAVTLDGPTPEDFETFKDMGTHRWAKEALYRLYDAGIVKGVSESAFAPGNDLKRADFMLMLLRLMNVEIDTSIADNFADVSPDSYYYHELATAKKLGITQGTSPTTFHPERSITREEMFTLTWRTLKIINQKDFSVLNAFSDRDKIAEYAKPAISALVSLELVAGDNTGKINPKSNAIRAEAAVFLDRVYTYTKGAV